MLILDTDKDEEIEGCMVEYEGESCGNRLLRHLQALVAWPGAVNRLIRDDKFRILLNNNLSVGLVRVQPCKLPLCSTKEMMKEYVCGFSPNDDFSCSDIFQL